jgi:hypothetical protein
VPEGAPSRWRTRARASKVYKLDGQGASHLGRPGSQGGCGVRPLHTGTAASQRRKMRYSPMPTRRRHCCELGTSTLGLGGELVRNKSGTVVRVRSRAESIVCGCVIAWVCACVVVMLCALWVYECVRQVVQLTCMYVLRT